MISWCISCDIAKVGDKDFPGDLVNIGPSNGLVPSGNKPLPGPVLTKIFDRGYIAL